MEDYTTVDSKKMQHGEFINYVHVASPKSWDWEMVMLKLPDFCGMGIQGR